ncbi:hypothetical protein Tco_0516671, partial [Tanacetum coccineum]
MISFGGRLKLAKSILGSLALYFFSLFRAPDDLAVEIEEGPEEDQDMDINEEDPEEDQVMDFEVEEWEDDEDWLIAPVHLLELQHR